VQVVGILPYYPVNGSTASERAEVNVYFDGVLTNATSIQENGAGSFNVSGYHLNVDVGSITQEFAKVQLLKESTPDCSPTAK